MFKGKKVKIRLKRFAPDQKTRIFVGRVFDMNNDWVKVEGKFFTLAKGEQKPRIDKQRRTLCIPRGSISLVRILPDNLDLDNLEYSIEDTRMLVQIKGVQPLSISE
ncbi:MAG: hypothetical protein KAQ99_03195 [Candidatus Aureabacteria bacterium]|nr:hypothetical protein [Candidatus Auribacterota bacterium]MCK5655556.1 hypothetical protein [Candidatus Auribacterota bacterium]